MFYPLYATADRYSYLSPRDIVTVEGILEGEKQKAKIRITCCYQMTTANYLQENEKDFELGTKLKQQLGKAPAKNTVLHIYEVTAFHDYELNEEIETR